MKYFVTLIEYVVPEKNRRGVDAGECPDESDGCQEVPVVPVLSVGESVGYGEVPVQTHGHQVQDGGTGGKVVQRQPQLAHLESTRSHKSICYKGCSYMTT